MKKKRLNAWPFFARTSHSSKATAALATVASEVALEEALARVEGDDGAPVLLRLQHQKQQPWVTFGKQMIETVVTDEAEAARKAGEGGLARGS